MTCSMCGPDMHGKAVAGWLFQRTTDAGRREPATSNVRADWVSWTVQLLETFALGKPCWVDRIWVDAG